MTRGELSKITTMTKDEGIEQIKKAFCSKIKKIFCRTVSSSQRRPHDLRATELHPHQVILMVIVVMVMVLLIVSLVVIMTKMLLLRMVMMLLLLLMMLMLMSADFSWRRYFLKILKLST